MAKRKIIWSNRASKKFTNILEFYIERNQSKTFSIKLYNRITKNVKLLQSQPYLGLKSTTEPFRGLLIDDFIVFYEITKDFIIIHTVWDCRQDPKSLLIK